MPLAFSWGFFAMVRARGKIVAPFFIVETFLKYPLYTTYVFTFLATALSSGSSYLLSQAVRHAIVAYLTRPMTLDSLDFAISIPSKRPFLRFGSSAGWSTPLTPINIVVSTPIESTELDISTAAFHDRFDQLWGNTTLLHPYIYSSLLSILDTSGATSANSMVGYPMVLGFAGNTYWSSTGGILPVPLNADIPKGALNISMSQQGLTAAVSCQPQDLNSQSNPTLVRYKPQDITNGLFAVKISTTCLGKGVQKTLVTDGNFNVLFSLFCPMPGSYQPTTATYSVIIDARGSYAVPGASTLLCQVTPKIQNMITNYSEGYIRSEPDPTSSPSDDAGGVGWAAVWGVDELLNSGQSPSRDRVGNAVTAIYNYQNLNKSLPYPAIWEAYIRGAIEFVGTALKYNLSSPYGPLGLGGQLPQAMTRRIDGTTLNTTLGWEYDAGWNIVILLPTTFIAVASILIVLFSTYMNHGGDIAVRHDFDPGGMKDTFDGLGSKAVKEGRRKQVKLTSIGDRRDGFVKVASGLFAKLMTLA
ncbi:hypothetical protein B0H19DRAFT_1274400 [Mycena capillaripes]|nr:hypothetical protein B0H19DRAFT_1274400 [Mycena capillaripes]